MGCDVAAELERVGQEIGAVRCGFNGAVGQSPRFVELAEKQTRAPERIVDPPVPGPASRRLVL
jgi:hypothetical protein